MKYYLNVLGGILGSAIVFPASLFAVITTSLGSAFSRSDNAVQMKLYMALSILTMIGALASIAFTAINYMKNDNSLSKILSFIVLGTGVIATISMIVMMVKGFSFIILFVTVAAVGIVVSGLIQAGILKID